MRRRFSLLFFLHWIWFIKVNEISFISTQARNFLCNLAWSDWTDVYFYVWIISSIISSLYAYVWDIKMDWGLFDSNAGENRFLREEIVYSSPVKFTYSPVFHKMIKIIILYFLGLLLLWRRWRFCSSIWLGFLIISYRNGLHSRRLDGFHPVSSGSI